MPDAASRSARLFARAQEFLPGGVSRNTLLYDGPMLYASYAKGCRVVDVDGRERIDFANNVASHIHGHAYPPIVEAVSEQIGRGTGFTMATEIEIDFAELLCGRSDSFDKIRFVNSGTEAVMAGMKAARAYTGRSKIAKVEGGYHGAYDYAEVSQAPSPENWGAADCPAAVPLAKGTPRGLVDDTIVIPYNDTEVALKILNRHAHEIAAVVIDPLPHRVCMVPASGNFVNALRRWTIENHALLIFDEVITFRSEVGGMQAHYEVRPDLTAMGKMIGGGFPVGALAGVNDVMQVFVSGEYGVPLPLSGTFSANPVTMTAGYTALRYFGPSEVAKLNELGDYARKNLTELFRTLDIPVCVTGIGSLFRVHLKPEPPKNFRETFQAPAEKAVVGAIVRSLYEEGFMMIHTCSAALSTPMTRLEIDMLVDALNRILKSLRPRILEVAA
ncbi:aminotransferase class III-fold pyridoxal phosphate-dependent enzyme [Sneathiella chungangensis]|uniref:Aminotransferase class III-fold pyridoxal phosphate-dependent enzyme n=1 Tax=Sneathiella chungangensis TaxID=1418234 RepID=A0A845MLJ6_9PROT|nr:aspartate aminotransferase family protein [Sneathiella chungangensis]MZR24355.1 aminotransferase class III-fold pyridoxal phosphate-dependent enzyme [Sneathiella chungangensis]